MRVASLVIIEPTATRWQALAEELSGKGVEVRQVHAATVAKLRGARDITGAKSDRVDARTLAGAVDYSHLVRPDTPAVACAHALCLEKQAAAAPRAPSASRRGQDLSGSVRWSV